MDPAASALAPGAATEAMAEPTDRIIVAMWLAAAIIVAVLIARRSSLPAVVPGRFRRFALWTTIPGGVLLGAGLLYSRDDLGIAARILPIELALGVGLGLVLVLIAAYGTQWRRSANVLQAAIALGLFIPVLVRFPDRLGDPVRARVAFEDMFAVAAGATPLHDSFPLYGMLLGYPIAPLVAAIPTAADAIVTYWTIALQLITVTAAVALIIWARGRRYLGAALLIIPAVALSGGPPGIGPFTYFQMNPIRTVLPTLAIATTCWAPSGARRHSGMTGRIAAGAVAGIAALNNPDFGLGVVLIAIGVSVLVAAPGARVRALGAASGGSAAPFLLWGTGTWLAEVPADWSRYLMFPSLFGPEGYMSVPMAAAGWHVAAVILFVAAFASGIALLRQTGGRPHSERARHGLLLTLVGGWSLLTLPYFMGRSLSPTLTGRIRVPDRLGQYVSPAPHRHGDAPRTNEPARQHPSSEVVLNRKRHHRRGRGIGRPAAHVIPRRMGTRTPPTTKCNRGRAARSIGVGATRPAVSGAERSSRADCRHAGPHGDHYRDSLGVGIQPT